MSYLFIHLFIHLFVYWVIVIFCLPTLGVGAAVEITVVVTGTIALVTGVLAGVLLFYCISKLRSWSPKPESFSQQQQAGPVYEEVLATNGEGEMELRENMAYGPVQRIELRENVAYGPVQH